MTALDQLRRLWRHAAWADAALARALGAASPTSDAALREFAHVLAAEEVWLARLERRAARPALWPELSADAAAALAVATGSAYERFVAGLTPERLAEPVPYTNSAGRSFATPVGDVLLHVVLHGQYHRGKVNLLLRQGGGDPAPVDYIAFVRGTPAARTALPGSARPTP